MLHVSFFTLRDISVIISVIIINVATRYYHYFTILSYLWIYTYEALLTHASLP